MNEFRSHVFVSTHVAGVIGAFCSSLDMRGQVRVTARRVWIRLQRLSTGKPLRFRFGLP